MTNLADLVTAIAYFTIPAQLVVALWKFPRLARMPMKIIILLLLFAFFILLCGAGHLMRYLDKVDTPLFVIYNTLTAGISLVTAAYLLPLIPNLLGSLDESLQDLVKLNLETQESKQKLVNFMAFLCHELRNPLFAITSSSTFLEDTEMTEDQKVGVGSIFDSALLMLRLVNDVLDISKVEAGKMELEERDFDLHSLLENLVYNMRMQVKQKHDEAVEFKFSMTKDVPLYVKGDSTRMLQMIYNLLSNSCKFTSSGHISLAVSVCNESEDPTSDDSLLEVGDSKRKRYDDTFSLLEAEEGQKRRSDDSDQGVMLLIEVADTGAGITPERVKYVFEPYSQAKLSDYRKHGGTGLGLSIISNLTKLMGGTISVASTVGEGSRFRLSLPMRLAPSPDAIVEDVIDMTDRLLSTRRLPVYKKKQSDLRGQGSKGIPTDCGKMAPLSIPSEPLLDAQPNTHSKIASKATSSKKQPKLPGFTFHPGSCVVLVVDDNCVNRKIIGKMLSSWDVEYKEAENGQEAVNIIKKSRNMTGDPDAPHFGLIFMDLFMPIMDGYEAIELLRRDNVLIPIVALTANALCKERERALKLGANEFHTKPILRNDVHSICTRFLHPAGGVTDYDTDNICFRSKGCSGEHNHSGEACSSMGDFYRNTPSQRSRDNFSAVLS